MVETVVPWLVWIAGAGIGVGVGVMSMAPPDFYVARSAFSIAALCLLLKTAHWLVTTNAPLSSRAIGAFVVLGLLGVGWSEGLRWIGARELAAQSSNVSRVAETTAATTTALTTTVPPVKASPPQAPNPEPPNKSSAKPPVHIEQHNQSGPNIAAGGNLTINPPVNPYAPVATYDYNGTRRKGSVATGRVEADATLVNNYERLMALESAGDPTAVLVEADKAIALDAAWLTPYVFKAVAYRNLGDFKRAIELFKYIDEHSRGNPQYDHIRAALRDARK